MHVFPSANHTRFEHSLGVMHLSKKALFKLKPSFESNDVKKDKFVSLYKNLSMAALLHDIGHAPFSHLGEIYYSKDEIKIAIRDYIENKELDVPIEIFKVGAPHELMSCYIILSKYYKILKGFYNGYDFELICRCIIGNKYNSSDRWAENIIIELLNSNTIDMDKSDYIMRDALMTGITVPRIDISRLFRNMLINNNTKKITFYHQAIQAIQNIIDSRDSLYLWVYNHHTVVYTDFILEFYLRHLIINHINELPFIDKLDPVQFFSVNAIADNLVSDSDVWHVLKSFLFAEEGGLSKYTKILLPQIFKRQFLKPLWKTIYEYNEFIRSNIRDDSLKEDLMKKMCMGSHIYRAYIVKSIIKNCNLKHAEIFIIPRSNKFYSLKPENTFKVFLDGSDRNVATLLPQKDFSHLKDVAFYICCKEDQKGIVKDSFVEIANKPLPSEGELEGVTRLDWFKGTNYSI